MTFKLDPKTNYIYTFFTFSAKDCAPNRDGGTGEIRQDSQGRVFTTQECFNQNVKNGVFYGKNSGLIMTAGAELLGCKNEAFGPQTLKSAQKNLLKSIAKSTKKEVKELTPEDLFRNCFDIPLFGVVNSDGLKDKPLNYSLPGSAGLIFLPTTLTQVRLENRGISNSFASVNDKHKAEFKKVDSYEKYIKTSDEVKEPNSISGSHYTDFLTEGVFGVLGIFNVKQLEHIAKNKFGIENEEVIRQRIEELYTLYIEGIWEGFKLLTYASTMRRGQQPVSLYVNQSKQLCDKYITAPSDILRDECGELPIHETVDSTLKMLADKLPSWFGLFESEWKLMKGVDLLTPKSE